MHKPLLQVEAGEDGVDYDKLIETFGCQPITAEQIERVERLTGNSASLTPLLQCLFLVWKLTSRFPLVPIESGADAVTVFLLARPLVFVPACVYLSGIQC